MELRPELMPPPLDEALVQRLAKLAGRLDGGGGASACEEELEEFNRLAGTNLAYLEFQGIYGSMDHDEWVRDVLSLQAVRPIPDITNEEMLEMLTRISKAAGKEHEISFWLSLLEVNLDPRIMDLIYWPGEYFGDGDNTRDLSPKQKLDIALAAKTAPQGGAG